MKVGIMGAGAVGCYVGGHLARGVPDFDVTLVGRRALGDAIAGAGGITLCEADTSASHRVEAERLRFATDVDALAACDVLLVCVKSGQSAEVGQALAGVARADALVLSLQNGVSNPPLLRRELGAGRSVLAAIVGFNVVWSEDAGGGPLFTRATSGPLAAQQSDDPRWIALRDALRGAGLDVVERADIEPHQWTKLLVNLNNAIGALSGAPSQQLVLDAGYRHIVADVVGEGVRVLRAAGIAPAAMRGVPVSWMARLLRLPTWLVRPIMRAQMRIDPEARSSMWQDLARGRSTEVDYLNGEIVNAAVRAGVEAPLNARIVELVKAAERDGRGSPDLSPDALRAALTAP
ncbi:MAG: 2-dehydropantoate 2-reductase [Myxococcales bacterium]|nr:2-dehydropantoate 2-reductase [Myxococcales bacterium]